MIDCCKPRIPTRSILTKEDLQRFKESDTLVEFMAFITRLNDSVKNTPFSSPRTVNNSVKSILDLLGSFDTLISEFPAKDVGLSRFGNPSFRDWLDRVTEQVPEALCSLGLHEYASEIGTYLASSFGDRKRIDYGTGHEANFMCFLLCLYKAKYFMQADDQCIVLDLFWKYIKLMWKLQLTYWLEPAGSHGVWGLDDYQFLPFLFGSAQLSDHKYMRPKSIHDKDVLEAYGGDYMYLSCISHINSIKTESLRWHSPMLDDISGVKKWQKVNEGMFKMYRAEVLNKLPIMQHFLFGSLIKFEGSANSTSIEPVEHVHAFGQEHPLCCSIRVPSAIAGATLSKPKMLPFD